MHVYLENHQVQGLFFCKFNNSSLPSNPSCCFHTTLLNRIISPIKQLFFCFVSSRQPQARSNGNNVYYMCLLLRVFRVNASDMSREWVCSTQKGICHFKAKWTPLKNINSIPWGGLLLLSGLVFAGVQFQRLHANDSRWYENKTSEIVFGADSSKGT